MTFFTNREIILTAFQKQVREATMAAQRESKKARQVELEARFQEAMKITDPGHRYQTLLEMDREINTELYGIHT